MNKFFSFLFILILSISGIFAQSTQHGIVKEYNDAKKKTPLGGVELVVNNAGSNVSGKDGRFTLAFRTLKPGDKVDVRKIEKAGYELFNKDALDAWRIANDGSTFMIVLCKSSKFKALKDQYNAIASKSYAVQQKKEEDKLSVLLKEGKLKQAEYEKQLRELKNRYDEQLENLDNYIDHFARIDLETLSKSEQRIIEMVKAGKIEEAIKAYEDMHLEEKYAQSVENIDIANRAIDQLEKVKAKNQASRDETFNAVKRMNDVRRLQGGAENFRKIENSLFDLVKADTTYLPAIYMYADHLYDQNNFAESIRYYKMSLLNESDEENKATTYQRLSNNYLEIMDYSKAVECVSSSVHFLDSLCDKGINVEKNKYRLIICYSTLGNIYNKLNDVENMEKFYLKCINDVKEYPKALSTDVLFTTYYNLGTSYNHQRQYKKAYDYLISAKNTIEIEDNEVSREIQSQKIHDVSIQLATACFRIGKDDEAKLYFEKAETSYNDLLSINPIAYRYLGVILYNNIASEQLMKDRYAEAEITLKKALSCVNTCIEESPNLMLKILRHVVSSALGVSISKQSGRGEEGLQVINSVIREFEPIYNQMPDVLQNYYVVMLLQKAEACIANRYLDNVENILNKAEKIDPKFPNLWNDKGLYYYELGNYESSKQCWYKVLEFDPNYTDTELYDKLVEKGIIKE